MPTSRDNLKFYNQHGHHYTEQKATAIELPPWAPGHKTALSVPRGDSWALGESWGSGSSEVGERHPAGLGSPALLAWGARCCVMTQRHRASADTLPPLPSSAVQSLSTLKEFSLRSKAGPSQEMICSRSSLYTRHPQCDFLLEFASCILAVTCPSIFSSSLFIKCKVSYECDNYFDIQGLRDFIYFLVGFNFIRILHSLDLKC